MSARPPIEELKALAHPLRYRIVQVLSAGERNVGEIEEASGIGQPALSQQLAVLRNSGLVETRKQAKLVFYRLEQERFAELARRLGGFAGTRGADSVPPRKSPAGVANFARLS